MKLKTLLLPSAGDARIALAQLIMRLFVGVVFIQYATGKLMHLVEFAAEFGIPRLVGMRHDVHPIDQRNSVNHWRR